MEPPEWISGDIPNLPAGGNRPVLQRDFDGDRGVEGKLKKEKLSRAKAKRGGSHPPSSVSGGDEPPEWPSGPFFIKIKVANTPENELEKPESAG
jgi:hypothetical protein